MNLRPHHALCIQKFTGHGYNEDFTSHMTALVGLLSREPDTEITLVHGCDELCVRCPYNLEGRCSSYDKVENMDRLTLELTGLNDIHSLSWDTLAKQASRILLSRDFFAVCGDCQWFDLCHETEVNPNV